MTAECCIKGGDSESHLREVLLMFNQDANSQMSSVCAVVSMSVKFDECCRSCYFVLEIYKRFSLLGVK